MDTPPMRCSSNVTSSRSASRTSTAAAVTSGPMPSPGRVTIFFAMPRSERRGHRPAPLAVALIGCDRILLLQRQADLVEAVEEAVLRVGVDVELRAAALP